MLRASFTASVKLKSVMIVGGTEGTSPRKMKVYTNRDDIDFSTVGVAKPVQEWDLIEDFRAEAEYPTKIAKFNGVNSMSIYIPENFGASSTRIYYIGLKGDVLGQFKREAVITTYESKPQMKDHQVPGGSLFGTQNLGGGSGPGY